MRCPFCKAANDDEYGEDRGLRYISMEFNEGTNLKDRLQNGRPPTSEAFEVVLQVAEGLKAVHDHRSPGPAP